MDFNQEYVNVSDGEHVVNSFLIYLFTLTIHVVM